MCQNPHEQRIHWNSIWLRARSRTTSHYTGLRARDDTTTWRWRCVVGRRPIGHFSFGLSQCHGHGPWLVCELALMRRPVKGRDKEAPPDPCQWELVGEATLEAGVLNNASDKSTGGLHTRVDPIILAGGWCCGGALRDGRARAFKGVSICMLSCMCVHTKLTHTVIMGPKSSCIPLTSTLSYLCAWIMASSWATRRRQGARCHHRAWPSASGWRSGCWVVVTLGLGVWTKP